MLKFVSPAFVAAAIATLGLASIIGSYQLVTTKNIGTTSEFPTRRTSAINNYKVVSPISAENSAKGVVSGKLCYPDNYLPEGKIAAKNIASGTIYTLYYAGTKSGAKASYYFVLLPGKYMLRYETFIGTNQIKPYSGYYVKTQDNAEAELQIVQVEEDGALSGIDLCYYFPPGNEPEF